MEGFGLGSQFLPGFRFHPTDQELIIHYLRKKVTSSLTAATSIIADIDLYKFNPWDLPGKAFFGEGEWFFFSPRDRKYPNGNRPNRAAGSGYWKATGIDKPIIAVSGSQCLGVKKALVFYKGRPPKGIKTDWVMHEYRLLDDKSSSWSQNNRGSMRLDDWVLCRVRKKVCIPTDTNENHETSGFNKPCITPKSEENGNLGERSKSINEWSDDQLLAYLLDSQEEGGGSTSEDSHSPKFFSQENMGDCGYVADFAQPSQLVSSMLDSIKRTLSFGALDEQIMLQPPNKRLHYTYYERSSPTSSFSVDQVSQESVI